MPNILAPAEPMLGTDRRYFKYRNYADQCKANLEAAGYTVMYEYERMAKYAPHKLTFWLSQEQKRKMQLL